MWHSLLAQERALRSQLPKTTAVLLSSRGGNCHIARAVYDRLRLLAEDTKLIIIATGPCMSAAVSPIWMAVPKQQRYITKSSVVAIHQTQDDKTVALGGAFSGRETRIGELGSHLAWEKRDLDWILRLIADQTGQSLKIITATAHNASFMDAAEAQAFGFAGKIL